MDKAKNKDNINRIIIIPSMVGVLYNIFQLLINIKGR
jgi:hypothetical protein